MNLSELSDSERFYLIARTIGEAHFAFAECKPSEADYTILADQLRRALRLIEETES